MPSVTELPVLKAKPFELATKQNSVYEDIPNPTSIDGLKAELAAGKIPLRIYEDLRIIDPKSAESIKFSEEILKALKEHIPAEYYDFEKNGLRILLADQPESNACCIKGANPPTIIFFKGLFQEIDVPQHYLRSPDLPNLSSDILSTGKDLVIGSLAELLGISMHELGHQKISTSERSKHLENSKFEEGYLYHKPIDELTKMGFHPAHFSFLMTKLVLREPKCQVDFPQILDVHPSNESTRFIIKSSVAGNIDRVKGNCDEHNIRLTNKHPLVEAAQSATHQSYVALHLDQEKYNNLNSAEKIAYLRELFVAMPDKTPVRSNELGEYIYKITITPECKAEIIKFDLAIIEYLTSVPENCAMPQIRAVSGLQMPLRILNGDRKQPVNQEHQKLIALAQRLLAVVGTSSGAIPNNFQTECKSFVEQCLATHPTILRLVKVNLFGKGLEQPAVGNKASWARLYQLAEDHQAVAETLVILGITNDQNIYQKLGKHYQEAHTVKEVVEKYQILVKHQLLNTRFRAHNGDDQGPYYIDQSGLLKTAYELYSTGKNDGEFLQLVAEKAILARHANKSLAEICALGNIGLSILKASSLEPDTNGLIGIDLLDQYPEVILKINQDVIIRNPNATQAFLDRIASYQQNSAIDFENLKDAFCDNIFPDELVDIITLYDGTQNSVQSLEEEAANDKFNFQLLKGQLALSIIHINQVFNHPLTQFALQEDHPFLTQQDQEELYYRLCNAYLLTSAMSYIPAEVFERNKEKFELPEINTWKSINDELSSFSWQNFSANDSNEERPNQSNYYSDSIKTLYCMFKGIDLMLKSKPKEFSKEALIFLAHLERLGIQGITSDCYDQLFADTFASKITTDFKKLNLQDAVTAWRNVCNEDRYVPKDIAEKILISIVKQLKKDSSSKQIQYSEELLSGSRIQAVEQREQLIEIWSSAIANLLGPDPVGGMPNEAYLANVKVCFDRIEKQINRADALKMRERFGEKVLCQYDLGKLITTYNSSLEHLSSEKVIAQGILIDGLFGLLQEEIEVKYLFLDFLLSPGSSKEARVFYKEIRLMHPGTFEQIGKAFKDLSRSNVEITQENIHFTFTKLHENFWALPDLARTLLVSKLIDSGGHQTKAEQEQTFAKVMDRLFKTNSEREKFESYLKSWIDAEHSSRLEVLLAALITGTKRRDEHKLNLGSTLAIIAPKHSGAATKMSQLASGLSSVDPEIREGLQKTKYDAGRPSRPETVAITKELEREICQLYREYLAKKDVNPLPIVRIAKVAEQMGAASIYYNIRLEMSDGTNLVLALQKQDVREKSEYGFDVAARMTESFPSATAKEILIDLMQTGKKRLITETDVTLAPQQYSRLQAIYPNILATVGNTKFNISAVECIGSGSYKLADGSIQNFFLMTEAPGVHFFDIFDPTIKEKTAALCLTLEIINLLKCNFESDRHGAQLKIAESSQGVNITHFDATALFNQTWTETEIHQLAEFLLEVAVQTGTLPERFLATQNIIRKNGMEVSDLVLEAQRASFHYSEYADKMSAGQWKSVILAILEKEWHPELEVHLESALNQNGSKLLSQILEHYTDEQVTDFMQNLILPHREQLPFYLQPILSSPASLTKLVPILREQARLAAEKGDSLSAIFQKFSLPITFSFKDIKDSLVQQLTKAVPMEERIIISD